MTPEELVEQIARLMDPDKSSEPLDSEQTLARLIREARAALSPRRRRRQARMYDCERVDFTRAMLLIQDASADDLRRFASEVVDLLWGEGSRTSLRRARRLDFDKEWEVDTIEEVVSALSRHTFYPFPKG